MLNKEEISAIEADLDIELEELGRDNTGGTPSSAFSSFQDDFDEIEKSLQLELSKEQCANDKGDDLSSLPGFIFFKESSELALSTRNKVLDSLKSVGGLALSLQGIKVNSSSSSSSSIFGYATKTLSCDCENDNGSYTEFAPPLSRYEVDRICCKENSIPTKFDTKQKNCNSIDNLNLENQLHVNVISSQHQTISSLSSVTEESRYDDSLSKLKEEAEKEAMKEHLVSERKRREAKDRRDAHAADEIKRYKMLHRTASFLQTSVRSYLIRRRCAQMKMVQMGSKQLCSVILYQQVKLRFYLWTQFIIAARAKVMKAMKERKSMVMLQCAFRIYISKIQRRRIYRSIENWKLLELRRRTQEKRFQMATTTLSSVIGHQQIKARFYSWLEYIETARVKYMKAKKRRAQLKASTLIQSVYRMYVSMAQIERVKEAVVNWNQYKTRLPSCIALQRHTQGELMRRYYYNAVEKEETRLHQAVSTMQKIFRGCRVRIRLKNARYINASRVDLDLENMLSLDVDCMLDEIFTTETEQPTIEWQPQRPTSSYLYQYRDDHVNSTISIAEGKNRLSVQPCDTCHLTGLGEDQQDKNEIDMTGILIGECGDDNTNLHETGEIINVSYTDTHTIGGERNQLKDEWKLKDERVLESMLKRKARMTRGKRRKERAQRLLNPQHRFRKLMKTVKRNQGRETNMIPKC